MRTVIEMLISFLFFFFQGLSRFLQTTSCLSVGCSFCLSLSVIINRWCSQTHCLSSNMDYRLSRSHSIAINQENDLLSSINSFHHPRIVGDRSKSFEFYIQSAFTYTLSSGESASYSVFAVGLSPLRQSSWSVSTHWLFSIVTFVSRIFREKLPDIFELLVQMNLWLEQMENKHLYFDGICHLLQVMIITVDSVRTTGVFFFVSIDSRWKTCHRSIGNRFSWRSLHRLDERHPFQIRDGLSFRAFRSSHCRLSSPSSDSDRIQSIQYHWMHRTVWAMSRHLSHRLPGSLRSDEIISKINQTLNCGIRSIERSSIQRPSTVSESCRCSSFVSDANLL